MDIQLIADQPVTGVNDDTLNLNRFVERLKQSLYKVKTPFVYGVLGDWGTGKTSILHLLEEGITQDLDSPTTVGQTRQIFIPIWFNAWKYENENNIIYPLLHAIKRSYEGQNFDKSTDLTPFRQTFSKMVATTSFTVADLALRVVTKQLLDDAIGLDTLKTHQADVESKLSTEANTIEKVMGKWANEIFQLEEAFATLLQEYANALAKKYKAKINGPEAVHFVILIDDLDRCLPETAIRLLECIKNFLTVKKCIFVLAVNPKIISQGVKIKYQGLEVSGHEYLEKILDYSFYVPLPDVTDVGEFATKWLNQLIFQESEKEQYKKYIDDVSKVLQECNFKNPRKIKRVLNRYLFFLHQYGGNHPHHQTPDIVRFIIIAEQFPDVFHLFVNKPDSIIYFNKYINKDKFVENVKQIFNVSITFIYHQLLTASNIFRFREKNIDDAIVKRDLTRQINALSAIIYSV